MLLVTLLGPETAHAMGATGAQGEAGGGGTSMLIMLVAIFAIFYFLMIRPESKRRKERQSMIDSLARGDKIVTIGGLYGEVQDVHDDKLVIRIAENLKVEVAKTAVSSKRN
ncbi:MAG: preprotein translocase subunit YajC [Candidatus Eisenbacteria bacterium]